jgi:hypothetical protein
MGWCDPLPWPVSTTVFIHTGSAGDVVAVRKTSETITRQEGRQANGAFE